MTNPSAKEELMSELDSLSAEQQRQVLRFARTLTAPKGTPGSDVLRFAGTLAPSDLKAMLRAIEEGCEQVDPHDW